MQERPTRRRKLFYVFLILLGIFILLSKIAEWWVESRIESLINKNPERSYDITFDDLDFQSFFKGITLEKVKILPINVKHGAQIKGHVKNAQLKDVVWGRFIIDSKLQIEQISFEQPEFEITLSRDTLQNAHGKGMQTLFGDILSRASLNSFSLVGGSVVIKEPETGELVGQVKNLNVYASEIQTDSVLYKHLIPFQLSELMVEIDSVSFELNADTQFSMGSLRYDMDEEQLELKDLSLAFRRNWMEISRSMGYQTDLIELDLERILLRGLQPSDRFYSDLDLVADKLLIVGLDFRDYRDKNMPRPKDSIKPMFKGMIDAIPVALQFDSIQLAGSNLSYSELGEGKSMAGTISIGDINGVVTGLTTFPEKQLEYGHFNADLSAKLQNAGDLTLSLQVPYKEEAFSISLELGPMQLDALSPTTRAMGGVEIESGNLSRLKLSMNATASASQNHLVMDYRNLKAVVIKEQQDHKARKDGLLSLLANTAIRSDNVPGDKKYLKADYRSERNLYRGPFNFIWASTMEGILQIVPGKGIQFALGFNNKKKKK